MHEAVLTSDTHPLTRVNKGGQEGQVGERFAVNCNADTFLPAARETLTDEATDLLRHSLAPATERALRGDLTHFQDWGRVAACNPGHRLRLCRRSRGLTCRGDHPAPGGLDQQGARNGGPAEPLPR